MSTETIPTCRSPDQGQATMRFRMVAQFYRPGPRIIKELAMSRFTVLAVALVFAVALAILPASVLPVAAQLPDRPIPTQSALVLPPALPADEQSASSMSGSSGGMLYTFDSGEAGFFTKTFYYDTGSEVVAFDTQFMPELAQEAIDYLRTQTDSPLTSVVITHPNPDKFNGVPAFQDAGATVIASSATAAAIPEVHDYKKAAFVGMGMFTEETYPQLVTIDETFEGSHTLDLGNGATVELIELREPGVSSTQTVAFIPELDALIVGDLVHHRLHAWLEGGIVEGRATPTLDGWIADLHELEETFDDGQEPTIYGGRGEAAPLGEAVSAQILYLETADQIVTEYLAGLGERTSELSGPEAGSHYAAIQAALEEAFPDYAFPDMISFSVYGLVNAKL